MFWSRDPWRNYPAVAVSLRRPREARPWFPEWNAGCQWKQQLLPATRGNGFNRRWFKASQNRFIGEWKTVEKALNTKICPTHGFALTRQCFGKGLFLLVACVCRILSAMRYPTFSDTIEIHFQSFFSTDISGFKPYVVTGGFVTCKCDVHHPTNFWPVTSPPYRLLRRW